MKGLTFVPAVEWTHYKGHMNFFGVAAPFENSFAANSKEEMQRLVSQARKLGAYISVNHPKCSQCPYLWEDENAFDWMEIWNGPMRPTNERAIAWWTELLKKGRRIPIVGGSDFHSKKIPVRIGNPVTGVYCSSKSAEGILEAIAQGHAFVTESANGVKLNLKYGNAKMGDAAVRDKKEVLMVSVSNLGRKKLILVTEEGEKEIAAVREGEFFSVGNVPKGKFAYVKVIRRIFGKEIVAAVSNPVYFYGGADRSI